MKQDSESIAKSNHAWGQIVASTLHELGISKVFFSPGFRSTPLVLGLERHAGIECLPVLDERSAAYIALGYSKRTQIPCVLLCTSGSAPTHWFPALTEANHSSIPIILLSADRPPELQDCGAEQTINQIQIFGTFIRSFHEMPLPCLEPSSVHKLRTTLGQAYTSTQGLNPGPVHLNFPFYEPFIPDQFDPPLPLPKLELPKVIEPDASDIIELIQKEIGSSQCPLVIAGEKAPSENLIDWLIDYQTPVICDSLSPLRECQYSNRILRYENLLRDTHFLDFAIPDLIIVLGPLPTSKTLRKWIEQSNAKRIVIEPRGIKVDPLSSPSLSFQLEYKFLCKLLLPSHNKEWENVWNIAERNVETKFDQAFEKELPCFEGKLTRLLSLHMPGGASLQVGNSMPVRDLEWFWKPGNDNRKFFGNRGVNGIDGTLSTALGIAHKSNTPSYLITGELAFLHDSNALLFNQQFEGSLTIFLINNQGGGIFENLPIVKQPEFEKCFATPQTVNFSHICKAHGIEFIKATNWNDTVDYIKNPIDFGIRIIEMETDRKTDRKTRQSLLGLTPHPLPGRS
jgi:2-succinyl-5-enolpyruvyl-6-hydroxy-3-cyclohexene-1-carboxylate synthase